MKAYELDTPALLVDLNAMENNLHRMAAFFRDKEAKLRPHFKNHKVPLLAWKQLEAGAIGITCATLREAEILVNHGVRSILLANEIAGESRINLLADLSRHADVIAAVDDERVVADMAWVSRNRGTPLNVVVDINVGLNRCGVDPGEAARQLAKAIAASGLRLRGVMGYEGHLQAQPPSEARDAAVRVVAKSLVESKALIEALGIGAEIVSCSGTGTYAVSGVYPGVTEIQAGSYLLMDNIYVQRGSTFTPSLTVLATVVSRTEPGRAVLDCGVKAISGERGLPTVKGLEGVELTALHAVHAPLTIHKPDVCLEVGQKVELSVHYSDATVNLHDRLYGIRNGEVEEIFRIEH